MSALAEGDLRTFKSTLADIPPAGLNKSAEIQPLKPSKSFTSTQLLSSLVFTIMTGVYLQAYHLMAHFVPAHARILALLAFTLAYFWAKTGALTKSIAILPGTLQVFLAPGRARRPAKKAIIK
jgi:hypothetical protein